MKILLKEWQKSESSVEMIDGKKIIIHFPLASKNPERIAFVKKMYSKWKKDMIELVYKNYKQRIQLTPMVIQVENSGTIDVYWKMNKKVHGKDVVEGLYNKKGNFENMDLLDSSNVRVN